ncbi:MAG TPA: FecR domain-containing protein [Gemmatimonadales bacterium]|nr:FecR domain-containing protein [Gemmatimonadales bacterium]
MANDTDWTRLARYFAGECTSAEAEETRRWIEADPARRRAAEELRVAWDAAGTPSTTWDTAASWRRLAARLHSRERPTAPSLVRSGGPTGPGGGWSRAAFRAIAAAAALVLAGGLWWSITRNTGPDVAAGIPLREVRVPLGQRAQFQLTDGTRVLLAPGSVLRYDTAGSGASTRELQLDGRAHFTVTHDPRRPFIVRTARAVTQDLGTEFVVTDYEGDPASEVVVASGIVAVRSVWADTARPATVLRTGDLVRLDPAGGATVSRGVDLRAELAWTEGRLVFVNTPVADVVTQLNRWYGGDVRLGDPGLAAHRFTAAYVSAAESTVVRDLATAVGAKLQRRGTTVVLVPLSDRSREN